MNNLIVSSIEHLEKRPIHPSHAKNRGLSENLESIWVVKGFSDGHIHAPLVAGSRYFKPFSNHTNSDKHCCIVHVLHDDPAKPYQEGDLAQYQGITKIYENVSGIKRPALGVDKRNKPIWVTRELELTLMEVNTKTETKLHLKNVLGWRSGIDPNQKQPNNMLPFCVKALELTPKEIAEYIIIAKQHERIPS